MFGKAWNYMHNEGLVFVFQYKNKDEAGENNAKEIACHFLVGDQVMDYARRLLSIIHSFSYPLNRKSKTKLLWLLQAGFIYMKNAIFIRFMDK